MTQLSHIARAQEPLLLEDMRPRCCERASGDNPVCDQCAEISAGYQACMGIGPEEKARRARDMVVWRGA